MSYVRREDIVGAWVDATPYHVECCPDGWEDNLGLLVFYEGAADPRRKGGKQEAFAPMGCVLC